MAEEDEWKKLPTEEKVQHKAWKARAEGYKECISKFPRWDEKSPEFSKYLGLVKKFVIDSNELNRIQGLQAVLLFAETASVAGKTCGEVISGIVMKCFNTKPRLRELGIEVCLMYVEIDKNELVQEELTKGLDNKQPKIVNACLEVLTMALNLFGSKVISVKPLIKQAIKLLDHRDKAVRASAKALFVEIYRWIGPAIRAPLQNINGVVLKELEDEWEKVGPGAQAKQTRFMRSQQDLREKAEAKAEAEAHGAGDAEAEEAPVVDAYDLLEPVEILSKLPKQFFTQIEEKKWQERKMALEACEKLTTENPKLAPDDYADLVKALKKVLSKDSNILLVVIAIRSIGGLASGLRKKFHPYSMVCLEGMFERFKEKKANVVAALQDAVDAIYITTNIQAISEMIVEYLGHKNPSIRAQVGLFLARSLSKTKSAAINKSLMKLFVQPLCKNIDHSTPDVREAAFKAIGAMWKVVGEAKLFPFLADLDKLKMEKIKECAGKTETSAPKSGGSSQSASSKSQATSDSQPKKPSSTKSADKTESKAAAKSIRGGKKPKSAAEKPSSSTSQPSVEAELNDEAAEELVLKVISEEQKKQVLDTNWKERLAGLQSTYQKLAITERKDIPCQALVKLLTIKPGWKDNNFNCLTEKFKLLAHLAEHSSFSRTSAGICLIPTVDKIGDAKCGAAAKNALTFMSEATGMPWVADQVLQHAMAQKNPKIQTESINWLSQALRDFGIAGLNVKLVIDKVKLAIQANNPAVRTSAFSLIGTLALFMGGKIRMFFESEKPAVLQLIDAEIDKANGQKPPAPCRGVKKQSSGSQNNAAEDEDDGDAQDAAFNIDDMVPRTDISGKITDGLVAKLSDKNWKIRKEGLDNVVEILNEAKFISPDLGDLLPALKARLSDSNKILVTTTLNIFNQLSTALGPHSAKHVTTISSAIIGTLADSKATIRQAALKCMDTWLENSRLPLWFEGETMSTALSNAKHTFLRIELFAWLSDKLTTSKKLSANAREGLELCVPIVFTCCEDRNPDVRGKAQAFIPALMRHLPFEKLARATGKLSSGTKNVIMSLLEKAREQLPASQPSSAKTASSSAKSSSSSAPPESRASANDEVEQPQKPASAKEKRPTSKKEEKKRAPSAQRKAKQSEEDSSPMFIILPNGKEQRMKDEAKLKTIKWNFTAPRDELVQQLQQQLSTCIGPGLLGELFHADFQHHLKAISMLQQGLSSDWNSTVACLDLLLRWFTLRFYDKNTTVHIKSLEYLKSLFEKLIENDYRMSEYEASAFLPHLMIKIGENKDNIRKAVQGIIKQISLVYSSSKLFNYIMDGIKSKNSRQRSECLDQIGLLIETYGVSVCQPSASKALKEIASNISDRDKSVRSSALNAIVAAYNVSGEIVFKQVGRLSEKDMSMLEERIKRSGKYTEGESIERPPEPRVSSAPPKMKETKSVPTNLSKSTAIIEKSNSAPGIQESRVSESRAEEDEEQNYPEHIARKVGQLHEVNVDFLLKPIPVPQYLKDKDRKTGASSSSGIALDQSISQLGSPSLDSSIQAIHELYEVQKHKENIPLLEERMEQLLTSSTTQIRMTNDRYLPMIVSADGEIEDPVGAVNQSSFKSLCKSHFAFLLEIFGSHILSSKLSSYTIYDFLRSVVPLMMNDQFAVLPYSGKLIQIMNMLMLRMWQHCDPTAVTCAIIKLLSDSIDSASKNYCEIAMKCVWKIARIIPEYVQPPDHDGFRHKPLKVSKLLVEIDRLWSAYPRGHAVYTQLDSDMPLRSLKTILLTLCRQPSLKILEELNQIPNPDQSEVVAMIEKAAGARASRPHRSLSAKKENIGSTPGISLEMKLSGIFKKIGDRQLTKQGLAELYEFKAEYPHYDVDAQIEELEVEFFRDYVKRGLKKIEDEKTSKGLKNSQIPSSNARSFSGNEHFERLNRLRANCGLGPLKKEDLKKRSVIASAAAEEHNSKVLASNTNSLNHLAQPSAHRSKSATLLSRSGGPPYPSAGGGAPTTSTSLIDLKRRLEQIKQNQL